MKQFAVKTRYVFTGTFFVNAPNEAEAKESVKDDCGLVLGGNIHSCLPDEDVDWSFPVHPDMKILEIKRRKKHGQVETSCRA
jgi:hypothetical protein